jgi:hypothetical protein
VKKWIIVSFAVVAVMLLAGMPAGAIMKLAPKFFIDSQSEFGHPEANRVDVLRDESGQCHGVAVYFYQGEPKFGVALGIVPCKTREVSPISP